MTAPFKDIKVLEALGKEFADSGQSLEHRQQVGRRLAQTVAHLGREKFKETTKQPAFEALVKRCQPVFDNADDEAIREAAAHILRHAHGQLFVIFKLDDTAQGSARTKFYARPENEAATKAAQDRTIYPLHRQDAPGLK